MDLELNGKVAAVTGASKGIGSAVVHALVSEGMHMVGGALTVDSHEGIDGVTAIATDLVEPSISPGPVATDLWLGAHGVAATIGAATGDDPATIREQAIASMPTGRFTTPEEVATLIALLASPRTGNVTGPNYVIDGGLVKTM